jgi:2-haloacid dehalogenase
MGPLYLLTSNSISQLWSTDNMSLSNPPRAILTDVFGTIVDWRTTVVRFLTTKSNQPSASASEATKTQAKHSTDWAAFAEAWRHSYYLFTRSYNNNANLNTPFKTVDAHHRSALKELLKKHDLPDLWTSEQEDEIALIWHYLDPWPDSANGLKLLSQQFRTCTLSNGNQALLRHLAEHGDLTYTEFFSGDDFGAYKPSPIVYEGAAGRLGLETGECALLAAHLGDLEAARRCGYQTIYVEREGEEERERADVRRARQEGWVDMWIALGQGGLVEVARRYGIQSG